MWTRWIAGVGLVLAWGLVSGCSSDEGGDGPEGCPGDRSEWGEQSVDWEAEVLVIVNEYRAEGATCGDEAFGSAGPLEMDSLLQCGARLHSKDMAERDFFDHTNPDGESPWERMDELGYEGFASGENISAGQNSPQSVVDGWMGSPGHCRNIMSPDTTHIGVGYFAGGDYGHLWTQKFGNSPE